MFSVEAERPLRSTSMIIKNLLLFNFFVKGQQRYAAFFFWPNFSAAIFAAASQNAGLSGKELRTFSNRTAKIQSCQLITKLKRVFFCVCLEGS